LRMVVAHNAEAGETVGECVACRDVLDVTDAGVVRGVRRVGGEGRRRDAVDVGEAAVGRDEHDCLELRGGGPAGECGGGVAGGVQLVEQRGHWIVCWRVGHACVRVGVYMLACAGAMLRLRSWRGWRG
jgi:hypothetical protein